MRTLRNGVMTQSFFYPGHIDHDSEYGPVQFADGLLVPVGGLETAVESASWGRIKERARSSRFPGGGAHGAGLFPANPPFFGNVNRSGDRDVT